MRFSSIEPVLEFSACDKALKCMRASACFSLLLLMFLMFCSGSAVADYRYSYTGNFFTTTTNAWYPEDPPPYDFMETTEEERIYAEFTLPAVMTEGFSLSGDFSFMLSARPWWSDGSYGRDSTYPNQNSYPYPEDDLENLAYLNPYYIGELSILAVDGSGLPTDWSISIYYHHQAGTGRHAEGFIKTSTNQDSTFGGYEGFHAYSGQIDNDPGTWSVVAVPEPHVYTLMLTGLGLVGAFSRRRQVY